MRALAKGGAQVLHPLATVGCERAGLPINIRNSFEPGKIGTLVQNTREAGIKEIIIGIARDKKQGTVTLVGLKLEDKSTSHLVLERAQEVLRNHSLAIAGFERHNAQSFTLQVESSQTDQAVRLLYTEFFL